MIKRIARSLRLTAVCAVFVCSSALMSATALAQADEIKFYDESGEFYSHKYYPAKLIAPSISLARPQDGPPGSFILRMTIQYGLSGCFNISGIGYGIEFQETSLVITVKDVAVDMRNLPDAPQYKCSKRTFYPSAEIPLTLDMLEKHKTKQIEFQTLSRDETYDIRLEDDYIQLLPPNKTIMETGSLFSKPMLIDNDKNALKLWFYPKGTVILRVGDRPEGYDIKGDLDRMAKSRGLDPLEKTIPDFVSPLEDPDSFYYVDNSKKHNITKESGIEDGIPFGELGIPSKIYGLKGDVDMMRPVHIFIRTPGAYE